MESNIVIKNKSSIVYADQLVYIFIGLIILGTIAIWFGFIKNDFLKGFLYGLFPGGFVAIYISRWQHKQQGKRVISRIEIADSGLQLNTIVKGKKAQRSVSYNEIQSATLDSTYFILTLKPDEEYYFFAAYQDYKMKKHLQDLVAKIN